MKSRLRYLYLPSLHSNDAQYFQFLLLVVSLSYIVAVKDSVVVLNNGVYTVEPNPLLCRGKKYNDTGMRELVDKYIQDKKTRQQVLVEENTLTKKTTCYTLLYKGVLVSYEEAQGLYRITDEDRAGKLLLKAMNDVFKVSREVFLSLFMEGEFLLGVINLFNKVTLQHAMEAKLYH